MRKGTFDFKNLMLYVSGSVVIVLFKIYPREVSCHERYHFAYRFTSSVSLGYGQAAQQRAAATIRLAARFGFVEGNYPDRILS
jgi:hypothetical protein